MDPVVLEIGDHKLFQNKSSRSMNIIWLRLNVSSLLPSQFVAAFVRMWLCQAWTPRIQCGPREHIFRNSLTPNCITITEPASDQKEQKFSVPLQRRQTTKWRRRDFHDGRSRNRACNRLCHESCRARPPNPRKCRRFSPSGK
jgi:hypothetical protein